MVNVYAFDIDETLEISGGPVTLDSVAELAHSGHIVGLCGNFAVVTRQVPGWHRMFSFIGPMAMPKDAFLLQIREYVLAEDYIMVGNILGQSGSSDDLGAARRAGWRFICESDFAKGER